MSTQGAPDWKKLRTLAGRDGDLRLSHFRRVKQLGSGDVGLVDLVQIQVQLALLVLQIVLRATSHMALDFWAPGPSASVQIRPLSS